MCECAVMCCVSVYVMFSSVCLYFRDSSLQWSGQVEWSFDNCFIFQFFTHWLNNCVLSVLSSALQLFLNKGDASKSLCDFSIAKYACTPVIRCLNPRMHLSDQAWDSCVNSGVLMCFRCWMSVWSSCCLYWTVICLLMSSAHLAAGSSSWPESQTCWTAPSSRSPTGYQTAAFAAYSESLKTSVFFLHVRCVCTQSNSQPWKVYFIWHVHRCSTRAVLSNLYNPCTHLCVLSCLCCTNEGTF